MASVKKFEDLTCWQEPRKLVSFIYQLTRKKQFFDFSLKDQIQRAAVSIISNIAECFGRGTKEEFIRFLHIAKASCAEAQTQLYVALDKRFITPGEFQNANMLVQLNRKFKRFKVQGFKIQKYQ